MRVCAISLALLASGSAAAVEAAAPPLSSNASSTATCRTASGAAVSWWVLYKQPDGVEFAYMDSTTTSATTFRVAAGSDLGLVASAPGQTLAPIYARSSGVAHVAYNDEHPDGQTDSNKAHAKGVLAVNTNGEWVGGRGGVI
jgi:hypothetical protein